MADAPELLAPNTPDPSGTEGQAPETPKTFTQEQLEGIVKERLNRQKSQHENLLQAAREQAAKEALEQAQMTEAEKYKLQLEEQKAAAAAANERATNAERKAALTGKVADVNAALKSNPFAKS